MVPYILKANVTGFLALYDKREPNFVHGNQKRLAVNGHSCIYTSVIAHTQYIYIYINIFDVEQFQILKQWLGMLMLSGFSNCSDSRFL